MIWAGNSLRVRVVVNLSFEVEEKEEEHQTTINMMYGLSLM